MSLSDQIVQAESGGDADATNPNSSASGAGQFIDSTWLSMLRQHRPDLANGKSDQDLIALKSDPTLSKQMVDAYAADNGAILAKNGLPVTAGTTYLAHFAGPNGAVSVLKADPGASAASILGPSVAKANPFLANMSAGDLIAWANRKMGTSGAAVPVAAQAAPQGVLSAPAAASQGSGPGILNAPADNTQANFQNTLAQLVARQQQQASQPVPALPPIAMAVPKGLTRARLLAALSNPVGG